MARWSHIKLSLVSVKWEGAGAVKKYARGSTGRNLKPVVRETSLPLLVLSLRSPLALPRRPTTVHLTPLLSTRLSVSL